MPINVAFVMNKVTLGQVFLLVPQFVSCHIIRPTLCIYLSGHISVGAPLHDVLQKRNDLKSAML